MNTIFTIQDEKDFEKIALETFHYQYENIEIYRKFVDFLGKKREDILKIQDIPFLPIEMFKKHTVIHKNFEPKDFFQSSGTADMLIRSKHYITDFILYEESILHSFYAFMGKPEDYIILGLLPNYSENPHSSLIYMVDFLMKKSGKPENQYFLYDHQALYNMLNTHQNKKILLFGVSFALLDFLDFLYEHQLTLSLPHLHIIETGGMKGRKTEMTKKELLKTFQEGYRTLNVFSEYSMTELLSQAYSIGENTYFSPNWMKIMIRSLENPFVYLEKGRTGGVNIIDLANKNSCAFIATQDLGKIGTPKHPASIHSAFEILGRIDHSDLRGCSLLVS